MRKVGSGRDRRAGRISAWIGWEDDRAFLVRKRKEKDLSQSSAREVVQGDGDCTKGLFFGEAAEDVADADEEAAGAEDEHEDGLGVQPAVEEIAGETCYGNCGDDNEG